MTEDHLGRFKPKPPTYFGRGCMAKLVGSPAMLALPFGKFSPLVCRERATRCQARLGLLVRSVTSPVDRTPIACRLVVIPT